MKLFGNKPEDFFDNPVSSYPWPARALIAAIKAVAYAWTKLYWPWTCDGPNPYHPTPEGERGRVFIANHSSMIDPVLLIVKAMGTGCVMRPIYKSEFESSKIITWFFARLGGMPVKRASADLKVVKRAVNALKRGENILIFPEGQRVWDPTERVEVFGGFAMIAQMAGADIVPIAIDGAERINYNKEHLLPRPARIRVRYGEAISFDDVQGENKKEKLSSMEQVAMDRVYEMREALRAERSK